MSTAYKMPIASIGPCVWYHSADSEPMAATITQTGYRSVMVSIMAPDNRGLLVKDGVRHVGDPELYKMPQHDSGCWDYTDSQKRLAKVEAAVAALEASGAELLNILTAK